MPTLLLIRHGENNFVGKRLAGRLPGVHLNEKGQRQAQTIADLLCKAPIKAIYSSPLERAAETAQPLAEALHLPVTLHDSLLEVNFGLWQGKTIKQLRRMKMWKVVQEHPTEMRFPEGESFVEAQQRIVAGLEEIQSAWDERDLIACFSHSDSIKLAVAHYLDMPLNAFQRLNVDTTSVTALYLGKGGPYLFNLNFVQGQSFTPPPEDEPKKKSRKPVEPAFQPEGTAGLAEADQAVSSD